MTEVRRGTRDEGREMKDEKDKVKQEQRTEIRKRMTENNAMMDPEGQAPTKTSFRSGQAYGAGEGR